MISLTALNRALKSYDRCLYATEVKLGRVDIYRRSGFNTSPPHFLFSLTDTWQPTGIPRHYGIEVVLNRIKAIDLWRDDTLVEQVLRGQEKAEESKKRDFRNSIESFLYEFRSQFQKATNDVNTANLKKLYRKENSHGYCEPGA